MLIMMLIMKIMKIMKIMNEFIFLNNQSIIIFSAIIHNQCIVCLCKNPHTLKNTKNDDKNINIL